MNARPESGGCLHNFDTVHIVGVMDNGFRYDRASNVRESAHLEGCPCEVAGNPADVVMGRTFVGVEDCDKDAIVREACTIRMRRVIVSGCHFVLFAAIIGLNSAEPKTAVYSGRGPVQYVLAKHLRHGAVWRPFSKGDSSALNMEPRVMTVRSMSFIL